MRIHILSFGALVIDFYAKNDRDHSPQQDIYIYIYIYIYCKPPQGGLLMSGYKDHPVKKKKEKKTDIYFFRGKSGAPPPRSIPQGP